MLEQDSPNHSGIEVKLFVNSFIQTPTISGITMQTNHLEIAAKVIDLRGERVLASSSSSDMENNLNTSKAFKRLATHVSGRLWRALATKLQKIWISEQDKMNDIYVLFDNVKKKGSVSQISRILNSSSLIATSDVQFLKLQNNKAHFKVRYQGWPQHFLTELQDFKQSPEFSFRLKSAQRDTVLLEIIN